MNFESMVACAKDNAGSDAFGVCEQVYLEGFERLVHSLNADRDLTNLGRQMAELDIVGGLTQCLQLEKDIDQFPEADDMPISDPLFIVGFGRTGSTFVHNLLALDENARAPKLWELWHPSPPPTKETYQDDPRIATTENEVEGLLKWVPDLAKMHPMSAQSPDECQWLMPIGPHQFIRYRSRDYWRWIRNLPMSDRKLLYQRFRAQISLLQHRTNKGRWVGKSFVHQYFYPVMFDVFPNARVLRLHRDPRQCVPSLAKLFAATRRVFYGARLDTNELGQFILELFNDGALNTIDISFREHEKRFVDLRYEDLIADPIGEIRRIYHQFEYDFSSDFEEKMKSYLARDRYKVAPKAAPSVTHGPEKFGLTDVGILQSSDDYLVWLEEQTMAPVHG